MQRTTASFLGASSWELIQSYLLIFLLLNIMIINFVEKYMYPGL